MLDLKQISEAMSWIALWFSRNKTSEILLNDLESDEGKLKLILEILSYEESLKLNLSINIKQREYSVVKVNQLLNDAVNYSANTSMVSWKYSEVLALTIDSLCKVTKHVDFDYTIIPEIFNWDAECSSFLIKSEASRALSDSWKYVWKSWKTYEGNSFNKLLKLKWDDVFDILEWNDFWADQEEAYRFITDITKTAMINKRFSNRRLAWISLLKWVMTSTISDVITFMKSFHKDEKAKETKAVPEVETIDVPEDPKSETITNIPDDVVVADIPEETTNKKSSDWNVVKRTRNKKPKVDKK